MARFSHKVAMALAGASLLGVPALAQNSGLPPGTIPGGDGRIFPSQTQDNASLLLRIDRLENQLRSQTGQMEQMQFQMRKLEDQLRKFQQDVDFRFQDSSSAKPATPAAKTAPAPQTSTPQKRGDAFDPKAQPDAPGAPRSLGTLAAAAPNLTGPLGGANEEMSEEEDNSGAPIDLSPRTPNGARSPANRDAGQNPNSAVQTMAALPAVKGPSEEYASALNAYKANQWEEAELGLQAFIRKYPKDQLVPEAIFYLGESYTKRNRHREAAENYLKVSTDFTKAARAPEAMVKLGFALEQLNLKEQACATFGEVGRKFPSANATLRAQADREFKRYQC